LIQEISSGSSYYSSDTPIVHLNTIAKEELKKKTSVMGAMVSGTNKNIEKYGKFKNVKVNTTARF